MPLIIIGLQSQIATLRVQSHWPTAVYHRLICPDRSTASQLSSLSTGWIMTPTGCLLSFSLRTAKRHSGAKVSAGAAERRSGAEALLRHRPPFQAGEAGVDSGTCITLSKGTLCLYPAISYTQQTYSVLQVHLLNIISLDSLNGMLLLRFLLHRSLLMSITLDKSICQMSKHNVNVIHRGSRQRES